MFPLAVETRVLGGEIVDKATLCASHICGWLAALIGGVGEKVAAAKLMNGLSLLENVEGDQFATKEVSRL